MQGFLIIGDAATKHGDGTISVLRAGLSNFYGESGKVLFQNAVVVGLATTPEDKGEHEVRLACRRVSDGKILADMRGKVEIPDHPGNTVFGIPLQFEFPDFGAYEMELRVGDEVLYLAPLRCRPVGERKPEGQ